MDSKTIIEFGFGMISWIIKTSCLCYLPRPSASADNTDLGFDSSWYHAQPHPIIVYCTLQMNYNIIQPRPQGASLFESEKVGKSPWIILFKKTRDELIKKNEGQHFIFDVN